MHDATAPAAPPPGLRPRTVGEILDASFVLYRRRFAPLLLVVTVLSLPSLLLAIALSSGAGAAFQGYTGALFEYVRHSSEDAGRPSKATMDALTRMLDQSVDVWVYSAAGALLQALSRGGACAAGAVVAWAAVRGEPTPGTAALLRQSLPFVAAATLVHCAIAAGALAAGLCCVLWPVSIALAAALAPACAMLVVERPHDRLPPGIRAVRSAAAACARSVRLSLDGRTIARGSMCVFTALTFVTAVVTLLSAAGYAASGSFGVTFTLNHYAEVLFLPVVGIAFALWYVDLRVRREGLDFDGPGAGGAP